MVRALLGLADVPKPADTADALALAICHLQISGTAALAQLGGAGRGPA